jgi:hypothetical protein
MRDSRVSVGLTQHADRVEVRFRNGATADADIVVGAATLHFIDYMTLVESVVRMLKHRVLYAAVTVCEPCLVI